MILGTSELERQEGGVVREDTGSNLQKVSHGFSLAGEGVNDVLVMVSDRSLEEEGQVGKNGSHLLSIDLHSGEELSQNDHIEHQGDSQQGILADVVRADSVCAVHEDLGGVFVQSALTVTDERHILDHNLVVNFVFSFRIESRVALDGVVEYTCL